MVPISDDPNPRSLQHLGPLCIIQELFIVTMPTAIEFNGQASFMTVEIKNISTNRILTPEFMTTETVTA